MILMALNMLNVHPWLRLLSFRMPRRVSNRIFKTTEQADSFAPALFGLCGGVMPCGPLQAMILYAASSGGGLSGGLTMLVFGVATVPLMMTYGTVASTLAKRYGAQINAIGAVIIILLGLVVINRGLVLNGYQYTFSYISQQAIALFAPHQQAAPASVTAKVQNVTIKTVNGYVPSTITVRQNVPVHLTIDNPGNDMCTESIVFPSLGIDKKLKQFGKTVIDFTPTKGGTFGFSSGCGMWQGTLVVVPGK